MAQSSPTPDASLDAQLELKKRARRRLVGATALALLAAIVLPMVMDHEPKQPVQDIQIRIPSQDRQQGDSLASRILPANPAATPLPLLPPAEPVPVVEVKAEEPQAAAIPPPGVDSSGGSSGGEQWVVQLGAYKEEGNVRTVLAKLKQMGLPTYTEPFDSPQGPRTRVRAGPFPSRDAAERAQAKVRTIGINGPVALK